VQTRDPDETERQQILLAVGLLAIMRLPPAEQERAMRRLRALSLALLRQTQPLGQLPERSQIPPEKRIDHTGN